MHSSFLCRNFKVRPAQNFRRGVVVDRSSQIKPNFGCPFISLMELDVETFQPNKIPADLAAITAVKPGSN